MKQRVCLNNFEVCFIRGNKNGNIKLQFFFKNNLNTLILSILYVSITYFSFDIDILRLFIF